MLNKLIPLALVFVVAATASKDFPEQLVGKWIVDRVIPTRTITCWSSNESSRLIGSEVQYESHGFGWKQHHIESPDVIVEQLTGDEFHDQNSGGGAVDSQVTLKDLGIMTAGVTEVSLSHPDANIMEATNEIPGDRVFLKARNIIVFSVCNVWFEAKKQAVQNKH